MKIGLLTREWTPEIYGGAGVHVQQLALHLSRYGEVDVSCFGPERQDAHAFKPPMELNEQNFALQTLGVDLEMTAAAGDLDIVHSHTWYANGAGILIGLLQDIPHLVTAHSLEPRRPWKEEQLGGGYRISSWIEQEAYRSAAAIVAVSAGMRADVLDCYPFIDPDRVHVIPNGIDTEVYRPTSENSALLEHGVSPDRPFALFVGRITRQKGLPHLLQAAANFDPAIQLVVCASSPDTPELGNEVAESIAELQRTRGSESVIWIEEQLPRPKLLQFYSHAAVFTCPSIYEPQGIVNLEAMACETAVVASDVGGIPEVVDSASGVLVHYDPTTPDQFALDLAAQVNALVADPERRTRMGISGRERARTKFSWDAIAQKTMDIYRQVLDN